jgi:glycosyltransferase involved in cell wall biosynthesis
MRRRLLFLTPTPPMISGNGLAMRAALNLEVLSRAYDVYLTVVPLVNAPSATLEAAVLERCKAAVTVWPAETDAAYARIEAMDDPIRRQFQLSLYPKPALCRFATPAMLQRVADAHPDVTFDALFVFRLYTASYAERCQAAARYLDMDDLESDTHQRLAAMEKEAGNDMLSSIESTEAQKFRHAEAEALKRYDRVFVSSAGDRERLRARHATDNVDVLPNGFHVVPPLPPPHTDTFTFLFVGTLGYRPNEDAAFHFCQDILPLIRRMTTRAVRVVIAGRNPSARLLQLQEIHADVPDIRECYRAADAVVVPIRAAGGTRIKILEAFSLGRPVVSTTMGAEGLAAVPEKHLLIADGAEAFAAQCVRLIEDRDLGARLAQAAWPFVSGNHGPQSIEKAFATAGILP